MDLKSVQGTEFFGRTKNEQKNNENNLKLINQYPVLKWMKVIKTSQFGVWGKALKYNPKASFRSISHIVKSG
jgi:hypothetical protein